MNFYESEFLLILIFIDLLFSLLICRHNFGEIEVDIFFENFEWDYKRDVANADINEIELELEDVDPEQGTILESVRDAFKNSRKNENGIICGDGSEKLTMKGGWGSQTKYFCLPSS